MNKIFGCVLIAGVALFVTSCNKTKSYADQLKAEKKAIERLIDSNGFVILDEYPADGVFKENEFFRMENGVYLNVIDSGNGDHIDEAKKNIISRFKVSLFKSDTAEIDGFANQYLPVSFTYQKYYENYYLFGQSENATGNDPMMQSFVCEGMAAGLQYVGDSSYVKMIVPFKLAPSNFRSSGEPLFFTKIRYTYEK